MTVELDLHRLLAPIAPERQVGATPVRSLV